MNNISLSDFPSFFRELYNCDPYSWQIRLAQRAVQGNWPEAIDLPTGSGKTACIDVAVFALACQASKDPSSRLASRRIFFCVNRRVIVDEAYERAQRIAESLWKAEGGQGILADVARALRVIAGISKEDNLPPLDVLELRGGIFRDNRWARSASQPTVICTTIDQLGSRLLFRGYGVSDGARPIQAALIAYDSLVLLDEAHISKPFLESLENVKRYLDPNKWAREWIGVRCMTLVPMTATPPSDVDSEEEKVIRLDDEDRKNESLDNRLKASKPALLCRVADLLSAIVEYAGKEAQAGCAAIGIIVNRVGTARDIYNQLRANHPGVAIELVIGAMRPIDRDEQAERLRSLVGKDRPKETTKTSFTIATQCLEVGADYDFDVLLTECASLDALRQRFGRLNRGGRKIKARALIVVKDKEVKPEPLDDAKPLDPIYGNALARTWNWLWEHADVENPPETSHNGKIKSKSAKGKTKLAAETRTIDFGIESFNKLLEKHTKDGRIPEGLLSPSASLHAPVMLPAYLDFWCQTSPIPAPDPDVSLFIHGPQQSEPDVQVCWRCDLQEDGEDKDRKRDYWLDIVALLPPSSAECMRVPLSRVRRWLANLEDGLINDCDVLGVAALSDESQDRRGNGQTSTAPRPGVLWRGPDKSELLKSPDDLRPGDTLVLPESNGGWGELGHIPSKVVQEQAQPVNLEENSPGASEVADISEATTPQAGPLIDVAEDAFKAVRDRWVLRLHPWRFGRLSESSAIKSILDRITDGDYPLTKDDLPGLLREAASSLADGHKMLRKAMEYLAANPFALEAYPDGRGVLLIGRNRIKEDISWFLPSLDEGDDQSSRIERVDAVSLADHTEHVAKEVKRSLGCLRTTVDVSTFRVAAERHDWGKVDERFQAMLHRADRTEAWLFVAGGLRFLAKSARLARTPRDRSAAAERSQLPLGFRHEMLSVQLAEKAGIPATAAPDRDLILHLIAAHHGHARPFAPVALDDKAPEVEYQGVALTVDERVKNPPHRLDSGIADRFWKLTRHYGWWGLAYLEALLRLADQQASADEDAGKCDT